MHRIPALVAAVLLPAAQPVFLGAAVSSAGRTVVQSPAQAKTAETISRIAKDITVLIEGATQGSGVLVARNGNTYTVLTAWHVVRDHKDSEELAITTSRQSQYQAESGSIERIGNLDLAILTFRSSETYPLAKTGDIKDINHGDILYVSGFPLYQSRTLNFQPGEVVANAEVGIDQGYQILYDNLTWPGMSGGPVLNDEGELVGIHGRGERDERRSSQVKTGVNQGVPVAYYLLFKDGKSVENTNVNPVTASDYLAQAAASFDVNGRDQTVIRLTTRALEIRPTSQALFFRGYTYYRLGRTKDAVTDYSESISRFPTSSTEAYINRANIIDDLGRHQEAISDYTSALRYEVDKRTSGPFIVIPKNDSTLAIIYYNRGLARQRVGNHMGAIDDYRKSISTGVKTESALAYNNIGEIKQKNGDYAGAIEDYSTALRIDPNLGVAYVNRSGALIKSGKYNESIKDATSALNINPSDSVAFNNRGLAKVRLSNFVGAIADLNKSIEINPSFPGAYDNRGVAKAMSGDPGSALLDFNKAIARSPRSLMARANRAYAYLDLRQPERSCDEYMYIVSRNLDGIDSWLMSPGGKYLTQLCRY